MADYLRRLTRRRLGRKPLIRDGEAYRDLVEHAAYVADSATDLTSVRSSREQVRLYQQVSEDELRDDLT